MSKFLGVARTWAVDVDDPILIAVDGSRKHVVFDQVL
jgi:hypothetical protein